MNHAAALDDAVSERLRAIGERARLRADPASLFRRVGRDPDIWQADLQRRWDEPAEVFILAARQCGKSWGVAGRVATESMLCPGTLTMITGPGERQAKELYRKITGFLQHGIKVGDDLASCTATETVWKTGSRMLWVPGNPATIRGFSPDLWEESPRVTVVIEEASVTDDAVYQAVRPMLTSVKNGHLISLGTAFGQRGFFWKAFENIRMRPDNAQLPAPSETPATVDGVRRYVLPVDIFPRLMAKRMETGELWVDYERRKASDFWFEQEQLCRFHQPIGSLFSPEHIQAAIDNDTPPLWPTSEWVTQAPIESMAVDAPSLF